MPSIEITDADFRRLQKFAVPLVDTTTTVITKLLDMFEQPDSAVGRNSAESASNQHREYGSGNLPRFAHAKLMDARFGERAPDKINWDSFVRLALEETIGKFITASELNRMSGAKCVQGKKETEGYKYLPSFDFSYQGVAAENAVKIIERCSKALKRVAHFEIEWRNKEGAHLPGQRAIVRFEV